MKRLAGALFAALLLGAPALGANDGQARIDVLDVHHLPLGDGKVSTEPERGYVMSCLTEFRRGGGAAHNGPWIHGDTWDLTQKVSVRGSITWPEAGFRIATHQDGRVVSRNIEGNGLPLNTPTGIFPISRDDPAYQYDRNPNSIRPQDVSLTLPLDPKIAAEPSCVDMGMIGVALNGVAIFNALDDGGRDAVAHETQDLCSGHPQRRGEYHYHGPSACLPDETAKEKLIGYAIDGFGIYSMYDDKGRELTDKDLDECHGRVSSVMWNGKRQRIYHYVLTREYPYTVGCFRSTPVRMPRPERGLFGP